MACETALCLLQTCRLLCHVSGSEPLEITCIHAEETFHVIGPQVSGARPPFCFFFF